MALKMMVTGQVPLSDRVPSRRRAPLKKETGVPSLIARSSSLPSWRSTPNFATKDSAMLSKRPRSKSKTMDKMVPRRREPSPSAKKSTTHPRMRKSNKTISSPERNKLSNSFWVYRVKKATENWVLSIKRHKNVNEEGIDRMLDIQVNKSIKSAVNKRKHQSRSFLQHAWHESIMLKKLL